MTYTKEINGRQVFSTCSTIQTSGGTWISNPSQEQILAEGWEIYVPPVVEPQPRTEPDMHEILDAVKHMLSTDVEALSDEDALAVASLFPTWNEKLQSGESGVTGERLWYDGKLYKIIQSHQLQQNWTPDVATSLYVEVSIEEFPEWVRPISAETAYNTGDRVSYNGHHYESTIDSNTWSPEEYPAGWAEI